MDNQDQALTISNPRLIAAVYFTLLAIITTFCIELVLYFLGINPFIPIFKKLMLAITVAASFGALFGERIVHSKAPYQLTTFLWTFLMVMFAVPFYDLGFVYFLHNLDTSLYAQASFNHLCYLYLSVLIYSYLLIGLWIAMIAGLAGLYLRGYLVYYLIDSHSKEFHAARKKIIKW